MKRESLKVEKRTVLGKSVKKIRREGLLPANIFGKNFDSVAVQLPLKEFDEVYKKVGETGLLDVTYGSETVPVMIHNAQIDPRSQNVVHADFFKVNLKEKIIAYIPIVSTGEPIAVQDKLGVLLQQLSELEVEALPTDFPEKIEVDVTNLKEVGDQITVGDLKVPSEVEVKTDGGQTVFRIGELVQEEPPEEEPVVEEGAEGEAVEGAEGETPAEGEKTDEQEGKSEAPESSTDDKKE